MTNKAYIVANEDQELRILNEFEKRGYCWINDQGKPISSGLLIARELGDYPLFIGERFETKMIYWQDLSKLVNEEIVYDGRKEEKMSEKYVVSQEFIEELRGWKAGLNINGQYYVSDEDIFDTPVVIEYWWKDDTHALEQNNRLIAIIRWVNGEDVFEVEKPKQWVVRSKKVDGVNARYYIVASHDMTRFSTTVAKEVATVFDTEEEAKRYANDLMEVVETNE